MSTYKFYANNPVLYLQPKHARLIFCLNMIWCPKPLRLPNFISLTMKIIVNPSVSSRAYLFHCINTRYYILFFRYYHITSSVVSSQNNTICACLDRINTNFLPDLVHSTMKMETILRIDRRSPALRTLFFLFSYLPYFK